MDKKLKTQQIKATTRCFNSNCNKLDVNKRCSKCNQAFYCSPECQAIDWKNHKPQCKFYVIEKEKSEKKFKGDKNIHEIIKRETDYKKLYEKWKNPRVNQIANLAALLLPGDTWKRYFLFLPLMVLNGPGNKKIIDLEMNSWQLFNIFDNSHDKLIEISSSLPLNDFRRQIIAYRSSVPSQLQNFRQAQIFVMLVDPNNTTEVNFVTFMPIGINAGSVPGTENVIQINADTIRQAVDNINNTPDDYIPNDNDNINNTPDDYIPDVD